LTFFLLVVAGLGMFVGIVCHFLFSGAREALIELGEMWADTIKRHTDDSILDSFPDVRGGRARKGLERGNERYNSLFRSGNLGIAFAIAWLILVILGGLFLSTSVGVEDNLIGGQADRPAIVEQESVEQ
jgi:hypothetical protein